LLELGQHGEARDHLVRALASLQRSVGPNHAMTSYPLLGLARIERARGNSEAAERDIRRVIAIREAASGADHPDLAIALHELAEVVRDRGRAAEADSLQQRADRIASRGNG
jgi:ATP/maltotriose-dependent transcriptional regulator MalT